MKVYIIVGTTGEYSDRREWIVSKVFYSKEKAEALANQLDELGRVGERVSDYTREFYDRQDQFLLNLQQLDPNAKLDYTGTSYSIVEAYVDEGSK